MTKFEDAFNYVIDNEKGLNTDPDDRGGVTNWGISERFICSLAGTDNTIPVSGENKKYNDEHTWWTTVDDLMDKLKGLDDPIKSYIKSLDIIRTKLIYQKYFWLPIYDQIENQAICNYIFDMTVQHGKEKAAELVQRAFNAAIYLQELKIDGIFGNETLSNINDLSGGISAGGHILKCLLIAVRESLFRCIVAHDKTQEDKLEGWLKRCYR
jgi:lysozyme family protein